MAAGDVKLCYGTSTDLDVTALNGLDTSASWTVGWCSDEIDNTSNLYLDYIISGKIQVHESTAPTAGQQIRIYIVPMISDDAWPADINHDHTVDTWGDVTIRDAIAKLGACISVAAAAAYIYPFNFSVANLFGGVCPWKFVVFIAHNTTGDLDADGNVVSYQGVYNTVAAS